MRVGIGAMVGLGAVIGVRGAATTTKVLIIAKGKIMANNKEKMLNKMFWFFIFIMLPLIWLPLMEPFELPKVVGLIAITLAVFSFNAGRIPRPILFVKRNRLDWLLLLWLGINLASVILNQNWQTGWWGQYYRYEGLATMLVLILIYWLAAMTAKDSLQSYKMLAWSGMINCLFLFGQFLLYGSGRLSGNMGNPNFMGEFLALTAVGITNWWLWPIFLGGILLTGSRTGIVGLGIVFFMRYGRKNVAFSVLLAVAIGLGGVLVSPIRPSSHFDSRWIIWEKAIGAISQKPIFGWGKENFETAFKANLNENDFDLKNIRVDKAHNETLEVAATTGIVGLIIYYSMLLLAAKKLWQNRHNDLAWSSLMLLVAFVAMSQLNVLNINLYVMLYFSLGMARSYS